MEPHHISVLSSLWGETEDFIQPHYKESYRLAIDHLVSDGRESYQEFLKGERTGSFLSEEELLFITTNAKQPSPANQIEDINGASDSKSSSGTYWPTHSDVDTPDLDLGWPEVMHDRLQTNIDLLFHPPRANNPTIKEVIRKHIQDARQGNHTVTVNHTNEAAIIPEGIRHHEEILGSVLAWFEVIAIVMDVFTDGDIFKETVDACIRGVPVYVLLDNFHLKSFLTMVKNQDVKIEQLKNMRVRTVKGQDYLCRSGAKFHGAMEQKFVLVDCKTAVYGSYSFTWSFEKINLSMVQVITGHLVESYDEEFRTLFARSSVPEELCPPEGFLQCNRPNGTQIVPKCVPHSTQKFERNDHLRHTLDMVYRKTCDRQIGMRDIEERLYEEPIERRPLIDSGMGVQNQMTQLQSPEMMNFLKRHSYAGVSPQRDVYIPQNTRHRASNWNIPGDTGFANGRNNYPMISDNYSQVPHVYRGRNMHQPYHCSDMQQNMPLDCTSKSFMRTWRIESYLKNPDAPFGDSCDYLDQYDAPDSKASSFMHSRMRSSLVFRSTIPEQLETNNYTNNSSTGAYPTDATAVPNTALHYSSMQWNPTTVVENRINNEELMLKRRSLQILDDTQNNISYGPGRNAHHSVYASLVKAKGGQVIQNPDILTDNWHKRHSVADPRSNTEYDHESSSHMYGRAFARRQIERSIAGVHAPNGRFGSNLNEDQRSVSHFDVKSITDTKSPSASIWREPPSRTVSAAALDVKSKESTLKSTSMGSPHFLKMSSKKIRSLLNIPEKKEVPPRTMETASLKSSGSSDTIKAEDEEQETDGDRNRSRTNSIRNQFSDDRVKSSSSRFRTEEHRQQNSPSKTMTQKQHAVSDKNTRPGVEIGNWNKDQGADNRLYSRFEPFCAFEKKHSSRYATSSANTQSQEKEKAKSILLSKGGTTIEQNLSRDTRGHHENKLGKFIQRVGNLIHKNK